MLLATDFLTGDSISLPLIAASTSHSPPVSMEDAIDDNKEINYFFYLQK